MILGGPQMIRPLLAGIVLTVLVGASARGQVLIGQNFAGSTSIVTIPPDTMGAAGVDHFVELNNARFKVFRKSDGVAVQDLTQNQFWTAAGATPTVRAIDPRVVYDPHARRWYATAIDNPAAANSILFAVSSSPDPTSSWTGFKIDADADDSNWADFPMLGFDGEGVFVSAVMPTLGAAPSRMGVLGFPKFDLLQPVPSIANRAHFQDVDQALVGPVAQMAVNSTNTFGDPMPMIAMSSASGGTLARADVTPLGAPIINPRGGIAHPATQPPTVVQPGAPAVQNLEANDWRFSGNAVLRNNQLYAVQAINDGGRAAVRFLRIDVLGNNIQESVVINDPARAYTFPSIAVNDFGDVVIGVTGTSVAEFASSYALVRRAGSGVFTPQLLRAGVDNYVRLDSLNRNRWGDYSATTVDPADPGIVWTNQEFVVGTNNWSTQVTELILPQAGDARWADSAGGNFDDPTMWHTAHGGAPVFADHVIFSRATSPSGSYTATFPPAPVGVYSHQSASVRQGDVRLDLAGNQWDLALHLEVGPYEGSPEVTLANGQLNSVAGFIAGQPTAEGRLTLDNATWNVGSALIVGSDAAPGSGGVLPGAFGGAGVLTIDHNSQLNVGGPLTLWKQGVVNLNGGLLAAATIADGGKFIFAGGTLDVDQYIGELRNVGGTLAPGGAGIGVANVMPGYFQLPGGALAIDIAGTSPADHDRLVAGLASLDGLLAVSLAAGFAPVPGDTFDILDFGQALGSFATISLPGLPGGMRWDLAQLYVTGALTVLSPFEADFDEDRDVDAADLVRWKTFFGTAGTATHMQGDADGDLDVDGADFLVWQRQLGMTSPIVAVATAVPEPGGAALMAIAAAAWLARRK
jgi:hypothetical protein